MTHLTKYGPQPFEKVVRAEFELSGLQSQKQAAYMQYRLMLLKPILRASVNYAKKSMALDFTEPAAALKLVEREIKPVKASLISKDALVYDRIVASGYHE